MQSSSPAKNCVRPTPESGIAQRDEQGRDDLAAHGAQLGQRPIPMGPDTQIDLSDRIDAQPVEGVDQQTDLHAVARGERQRRQQFPAGRVLAAERLPDAAQLGPQRGQQRPGHQFGDPPATGCRSRRLAGIATPSASRTIRGRR